MSKTLSGSFVIALALTSVEAALPAPTIEGCRAFAATFDNTCSDSSSYDMASDSGVTMNCTGSIRCAGTTGSSNYTESNPCSFVRKLCVSCYEDSANNNAVMVNVKSNGLPSHCFTSTVNNPEPREYEWNVRWQPATSSTTPNYDESDLDSQAKTDELMCDIQRTASTNMAASS